MNKDGKNLTATHQLINAAHKQCSNQSTVFEYSTDRIICKPCQTKATDWYWSDNDKDSAQI